MTRRVRVLYFAWLRERIGKDEETITLGERACTLGDLAAHLRAQSPGHARAFAELARVRCAMDEAHADFDDEIGAAREVAFFPPMTGG